MGNRDLTDLLAHMDEPKYCDTERGAIVHPIHTQSWQANQHYELVSDLSL